MALTDATGAIVNQYYYGAYGSAGPVTEGVPNPFRFQGAIWDNSTGLLKMGERYYDPKVANWTQMDPKPACVKSPGDLNAYSFARDNPVNNTDPSGLDSCSYLYTLAAAFGGYVACSYACLPAGPGAYLCGMACSLVGAAVAYWTTPVMCNPGPQYPYTYDTNSTLGTIGGGGATIYARELLI